MAEPALHVGEVLHAHGVDFVDAAMWTRVGQRVSGPRDHPRDVPLAARWYITLREYAMWHFRLDIDAFDGDGVLHLVMGYEDANLRSRAPMNRTLSLLD